MVIHSVEEDAKKAEPEVNEEEKLKEQRKKDELKLQIQQKQQLIQLQQKQAEAYNLAHPGQFASIYNSHGSIHHVMQPEQQYEELVTDPMQYAAMVAPPPPPEPQLQQSIQPAVHYPVVDNVLPPGTPILAIH